MRFTFLASCLLLLAGCSAGYGGAGTSRRLPEQVVARDLRPDIVVMTGSLAHPPELRKGMHPTVVAWGNPHDIERNFTHERNLQPYPKTVQVPHPALRQYAALELDGHQLVLVVTKEAVKAVGDSTGRKYCSRNGDECVTVSGNTATLLVNGVPEVMPKEQFFKVIYPDGYYALAALMAVRDFGPQEILLFMPKK